jgi:geranylgeranyl diphosphate synthase type I
MVRLAAGTQLDRCGAMVVQHLTTGGKRLRARLALAAVHALGGTHRDAVGWAAACELLHNASLVHDDLQDGDRVRRGSPTLWARHGEAQAINAGDLLLMLPTLALDHVDATPAVRWELARTLAWYAAETVRGQSLEMSLLGQRRLRWVDYERAAHGKTAGFFALPVAGAAAMAELPRARANKLASCFSHIGLVFQIQDDIIDLFGHKGREAPGADLREGKVSALVSQHLELYPEEEAWWLALLETPRDETTERQVEEAKKRFVEGGALEELLERVYAYASGCYDNAMLHELPELHRVACATLDRALLPLRELDPSMPTYASATGRA